jgi:hypothetical protein
MHRASAADGGGGGGNGNGDIGGQHKVMIDSTLGSSVAPTWCEKAGSMCVYGRSVNTLHSYLTNCSDSHAR